MRKRSPARKGPLAHGAIGCAGNAVRDADPWAEDRPQREAHFDALISVHNLLRRRRCAVVRSLSCSSFACTSLGGKMAGFLSSSGLMYLRASVFGLPEPIRFVSSAEFFPSSMKLMNL